jgi:hypothetical protein
MKIFGFLGSIFGIGKDYLANRAELKRLKQVQAHEIVKAETQAITQRIMSNTESDNQIDLITARNKRFTSKDEVITYLFLVPVAVATFTPFIQCWQNGDWENLNNYVRHSYQALDLLPTWYKYVLGAIIIDVLGFRSFARKIIDRRLGNKTGITLKK